MSSTYDIKYSIEAFDDLRQINSYISEILQVEDVALAQIERIRKKVKSLSYLPERFSLVQWEPWSLEEIRQTLIDNYIIYYHVDNKFKVVEIVRIFYGRRNIKELIRNHDI